MEADVDDRASPVFSADEDVHNPSGGGLRYELRRLVLQKTDSSATMRGKVMGRFR